MGCRTDECEYKSCFNGGVCIEGTCLCQNGYSGEDCRTKSGYTCTNGTCEFNSAINELYIIDVYDTFSECNLACNSNTECFSTPYYGSQDCPDNSEWVAVSASGCCRRTNPYLGVQTGFCYTSCIAAKNGGNNAIVYGTGETGGGGSDCDWNSAVNCLQVTKITGNRCGDPQSIDVTVRNICNHYIKIYICIQRSDGTWSGLPDGTFSTGTPFNGTANNYVCKGTGQYKVFSMPINDYNNNNCPWPSCN